MKIVFALITYLSIAASLAFITWFIAEHEMRIIEQSARITVLEDTLAKEQGRLIVLMDFVQARSFNLPTGFDTNAFTPTPITNDDKTETPEELSQ